ncbi:hypothetical protein LZ32DRAFT_614373 [Colletotrichum eremochloae]|nr:hypothetical protein LZ32DRAFT_614373 [Colletotrichum eremochloae]
MRSARREARRQRKELWTPTLSSNPASIKASQQSATGRPSTSSQLSYASREDDPFADADGGNQPWQDDVSGFYEHMARENGNGNAFDRASVHPAFNSPNIQPYAFQPQPFTTELELGTCNQEAIWEGGDSRGAIQTLTSQQLATGSAQQPPYNNLPPSMLQDESRASNRFRNIATSSVFSINEPAQPVPLRSEDPLGPRPHIGYGNVAASSSFYTDAGPARPHPPRTNVSLAAARARSDMDRYDPSHRSRPDAADQPSAGLPYRPGPVPSGHPHQPATQEGTLRWEEQKGFVERPTFTEYYENKRKPKPLPPSGRRQFYGRRPSPPPSQLRSPNSCPQPGPTENLGSPTVPEAASALTLEEVRRWSRAKGPVAPSDVSTVWPQDSISNVGFPM